MAYGFYNVCSNCWCSKLLGQVKVKMKEIEYSVYQNVIGCKYTSDINQQLVPDTVTAILLYMDRFPDQSQVNELIRRIDSKGVE